MLDLKLTPCFILHTQMWVFVVVVWLVDIMVHVLKKMIWKR